MGADSLDKGLHAQALEELRSKHPDPEVWAMAIGASDGSTKKAVSYYIRERAKALKTQADADAPASINVWDCKQVTDLPARRQRSLEKDGIPSSWIGLAALGLWLIGFLYSSGPAALLSGDRAWQLAVLAESLGVALGAVLLGGAVPGLFALGLNELVARLGKSPPLPRLRLFGLVSVGFAYPALLGYNGLF